MKKRVSIAIASIFVFPFCSLLYTFGIAGVPKPPATIAEIPAPAGFADEIGWKQLPSTCRSHSQFMQGSSKHSMPLFAHLDASPWRQRLNTAPYEAGEDIPFSQKKEFLLSVDKAVFSCSEDACDHYYRQCGLEIDYTLYSEQVRTAASEAMIICRARIVYQTEGGYHLNSEAGPETCHHTLKDNAEYSSQLSLHFHFSEYEQVTEVQLDKFECRVHPGDYVSRVTH
jgi:hypothetical protein